MKQTLIHVRLYYNAFVHFKVVFLFATCGCIQKPGSGLHAPASAQRKSEVSRTSMLTLSKGMKRLGIWANNLYIYLQLWKIIFRKKHTSWVLKVGELWNEVKADCSLQETETRCIKALLKDAVEELLTWDRAVPKALVVFQVIAVLKDGDYNDG